jgi:hypothetical protein
MDSGALFSGIKRPEREAGSSLPSSVEVKNSGTIPTLPIRPHGMVLNWLSTGATLLPEDSVTKLSYETEKLNDLYLVLASILRTLIDWYDIARYACRFIWNVLSDYEDDEDHIQDIAGSPSLRTVLTHAASSIARSTSTLQANCGHLSNLSLSAFLSAGSRQTGRHHTKRWVVSSFVYIFGLCVS